MSRDALLECAQLPMPHPGARVTLPEPGATWHYGVDTPFGPVYLATTQKCTFATGLGVPTAVVQAADRIGIPMLKRGVPATVNGDNALIVRPRFGLRIASRRILVDSSQHAWEAISGSMRKFCIVRRRDGSAILCQQRQGKLLDAAATQSEVSLTLAIAASGIVQSSSLLYYLSLP